MKNADLLAEAVLKRAFLDYRDALESVKTFPNDKKSAAKLREIEDFFLNPESTLGIFTDIDGEALLRELKLAAA